MANQDNLSLEIEGLEELKEAFRRNPEKVKREVGVFLQRGMAVYRRTIQNNPWRMGMTGGGAPVASENGGNLRDTHKVTILPWEAFITPTAPYARYVHGDFGKIVNSKGVQLRPWLDYAKDKGKKDIEKLEADMMDNIVEDLAK